MKMEIRVFDEGRIKHLIFVCEDQIESSMFDEVFGSTVQNEDGHVANVKGSVQLSDGFYEHYLRVEKV